MYLHNQKTKPELFEIELINKSSRPLGYYAGGETITGVVHVIVGPSQICKCTGIALTARGKALFLRFSKGREMNVRIEETYLNNTQWLLELGAGGNEIILPPGNHDYPFECVLPHDLPPTFVTSSGFVAYEIQIEMITVSFKYSHKANISFHMNSVVDLNLEPFAQLATHPLKMQKVKTLCCCCCESGPLWFSLTFSRGAYVSGESIQFEAELRNESKSRVEYVTVSLVQKVIYKLPRVDGVQFDHTTICSVEGPSLEPGNQELWTVNTFEIPSIASTSTIKCIVEVQYLLKTEMHLRRSALNLKDEIPILIGTVPLRTKHSSLTLF